MNKLTPYFAIFIVMVPLICQDVIFEPPQLLLTEGRDSALFTQGEEIFVTNQGGESTNLRFISSRAELIINPSVLNLSPGEKRILSLTYEGSPPQEGSLVFPLVVLSDQATIPHYMVYSPSDFQEAQSTTFLSTETYDHRLVYYYSPSCRSCIDFLEGEIPRLERVLSTTIHIKAVNIFNAEGMDQLNETLNRYNLSTDQLPLLDTGRELLAGEHEIKANLEAALRGKMIPRAPKKRNESLPLWILVLGAGLLDGINPCAFSTLIFLLAYLGMKKRQSREILLVGICFSLSVFVTYTAVGAGAFLLLRESSSYTWISTTFHWLGGSLMLVLAILSFFDWIKSRRGNSSGMSLQLSQGMKRAVHKSVRKGVGATFPYLGALGMGFMVSIYELGCTGQIYLPTLYLMTQKGEGRGYALLFLYNLAFILPLVAVFILSHRGLTSKRLGQWFTQRLSLVKLVTALFFLGTALLIFLL